MVVESTLTVEESDRVCSALSLWRSLAKHPETRSEVLAAQVPSYLILFLKTESRTRQFEYLRLSSLGVVCGLFRCDSIDVITFLSRIDIVPPCIRIMVTGSDRCKTMATFIVRKVALSGDGLEFTCKNPARFSQLSSALSNMAEALDHSPSLRVLKQVIRCYFRLSDNQIAREVFKISFPISLSDGTFENLLEADQPTTIMLDRLLQILDLNQSPFPHP